MTVNVGEIICKCGHPKVSHANEWGDITYCRACNCDHFFAVAKVVPLKESAKGAPNA